MSSPRIVTVSFFMNTMKKIDAIEGVVEVDFILYATWCDPDLVGVAVEDRPPYTEDERSGDDTRPCCWNPMLEINNDVSLELMWGKFPPSYQDAATGKVMWGGRYRGGISNTMDLRQFPLDSDYVSLVVGPKEYPESVCQIEIDDKKHGFSGAPGDRIKSNTLEEWDLDVPTVVLKRSGPTGSGSYYSNIEFGIVVHRRSWYYASKIMAIVYMLTLVSWTVLFMPPSDFVDRLNIILVLFLSTIAFLYVAGMDLPKVSYLTLLDKLMLIAFFAQFLGGFESFVVYLIDRRRVVELSSMTVMPPAACAAWFTPSVNGCALSTADRIDMICFIIFPIGFILANVAFVFYAKRKRAQSRNASKQEARKQAEETRRSKAQAAGAAQGIQPAPQGK